MDLEELRAKANDREWPVVPDGRAFIRQWFSQREEG
jgi:hypothetical protein